MNHDYQKTVFKKYIVYSQKFTFKLNNGFDNILSDLCLVKVHLTDIEQLTQRSNIIT